MDATTRGEQSPDLSTSGGVIRPDGEGPFALHDAGAMVGSSGSWRVMAELMRADRDRLAAQYPAEPVWYRFYPTLLTSWSYRLSHTLRRRGHKLLPVAIMWISFFFTGCQINPNAVLGPGLLCIHPQTINIGGGIIAGKNLTLQGVNSMGAIWRSSASRPEIVPGSPRLGDDVLVGNQSSMFGPILVGDRVEIGASSLVLHDAPADAVIKGSPAR